jgi:hypothetical protein
MFFAGNTSKRGFSTRKCKESARMAFLRTSLAAARALVSGARSALVSGAPQSSGRDSRARGIGLRTAVVALAMLGVAVVGALPAAVQAKALASASMTIVDFVWINADTGLPVTMSLAAADNPDVLADEDLGRDRMTTTANLTLDGVPASVSPDTTGRRPVSNMQTLLSWTPNDPPTCAPDASGACSEAPNFAPINPPGGPGPYPVSDYARSDASYEEFYARFLGTPVGNDPGQLGFRAEISLPSQPPVGGSSSIGFAETHLISTYTFTAQESFDSYFTLTVQSQALARLDEGVGSVSASTEFTLGFLRADGGLGVSARPDELNLNASILSVGPPSNQAYVAPTPIEFFNSSPASRLSLIAGEVYTINISATVTASANLEPAEIPAPPQSTPPADRHQ